MAITVSAPAKVLLFGEHAVVYGSACVAAAIDDLRIYASIESTNVPPAPAGAAAIELIFRDIVSAAEGVPLHRSFALASLQAIASELHEDAHYLPRPSDAVLQRIDALLHHEAADDGKALRPALFLCLAVLRSSWLRVAASRSSSDCEPPAVLATSTGLQIVVSATERFPIGAGLGSSAAFSVALAGALLLFADHAANAAAPPIDDVTRARINALAFSAEVILHGAPSGVDNTIATYGGALVFTRQATAPPMVTRIAHDALHTFAFLLVNTRVARSTKQQVARVRAQRDADTERIDAHFAAIDALAKGFVAQSEELALTEAMLAQQLMENHALLQALGVSHDAIERVVSIARRFNAATKLTGAGGGGCTLTLLPTALDVTQRQELMHELEASGFECFTSAVGGNGVQREV